MATWREQLRPASFRGVPFFWKDVSTEVGRKTARHDYPGLDECYIEDLGQAPRSFTLDAFVLGSDYMAKRDALIAALAAAGSGELIHPTYGKVQVSHEGTARVSESTREGGMAQFSLYFITAGVPILPSISSDTSAAVIAAADVAATSAQAEFAAAFGVKKAPEFVATGALAAVRGILAQAEALRSTIATATAGVTATTAAISNGAETATGLIAAPILLATTVYGLIQDVLALPERLEGALAAYRVAGDFFLGSATIPRTTPSRIRSADNQLALQQLVERAAVIEACRAAATLELTGAYGHSAAVGDLRRELAARLDLLSESASDPVYLALVDLRTALLRDLAQRGSHLARLVTVTPAATLPSLVLAHRLYGDAGRSAELVDRNRLRHPGFVPGGQPLEVLSAD